MVTSRVPRIEIPTEEPKKTPQEVLRLQSLLLDNGRKMVEERMRKDIEEINTSCRIPKPLGLNTEQTAIWYDDLEKLKNRASAYEYALNLPHIMIQEYGEDNFIVDKSKDI